MKKYFLILVLLLVCCFQSFSQYNEARRIDSVRLDSLKKILPLLKDSAKVDCLNQLAVLFMYSYAYDDISKMDSIYYYAMDAKEEATEIGYKKGIAFSLINLARTQLFAAKNIQTGEKLLNEAISIGDAISNPNVLAWAYYESGANNYVTALKYENDGLKLAEKDNSRPLLIYGYELLSDIYHHLGKNDSAYHYLRKCTTLKDSLLNKQFLFRLNNYKRVAEEEKKQAQLLLLNKDNKIKDAQLKQASMTKKFLIGGLIILFIAGISIFRSITLKRRTEKLRREQLENNLRLQQLENQKKQAELQQQAAELEMRALRAQMNPHFIFNCLSSINRIILKHEIQAASDYLTRFSRLIRMVLINSQKSMIPLEDELQMLRLYLDMERMRFKNSFDYRVTFTNTIDEGSLLVPPLLLQPFCENAIWHGLMQKEGQGHLHIDLSMHENIFHCVISDDGIGREKAAELKSKSAEREKSMGLTITAQRLALLNKNANVETFYIIEDMRDENGDVSGTKVVLKIAYQEMAKEIV